MLTRKQLVENVLAARGQNGTTRTWREVAGVLYPHLDKNATGALLHKLVKNPKYYPGGDVCKKLKLLEPKLTDPCPTCGVVHDIRDESGNQICPVETPVDIVVYEVDDSQLEALKSSRAPVQVIRKRPPKPRKPSRPRVRVELPADLTPDERAIIMKLTPDERRKRLLGKEQ
jgi:hypothetical protein